MDYSHGGDNEWKKEVECEESAKSGVVYREAASDSLYKGFAYVRDRREKVSNDSGASEGHLSSGQNVAYERGHHYEKEEDDPNVSCLFIEVGAVV